MELKIEKLVYGGDGLGHESGATVFVPYVLPGETVAAAPVETKKKFVRARMDTIVTPSPERIAAPCPHFSVCGGCNYQHIPYDAQLVYKAEILRETLRRIGRVDWTGEITTHGSPPYGYRNRAQWKIRARDKAETTSKKAFEIGYFRANSTALCPIEQCPIVSPLLERSLKALGAALVAGELPRELREIEVFADSSDAKMLLNATFAGFPSRADEHAAKFRMLIPEIESLLFHDPARERMELDGPGFVTCEAAGETFRVGHFSFFQVNRFLTDELVTTVAGDTSGAAACDLYAGVGLFSLPLARRFQRVIAVESNPAAVRDLESNASQAAGITVRTAEVERAIERTKEKLDLIVLDPPRAGLEPGAAARLARMGAQRITYVSCEPPTLARDLAGMLQGGYEIRSVDLFDLFPQTFHMETVVKLERRA
ncbi:MAG TPA: class I SAM-dependent RNA methyltransferase [Candidatus Acidoferrales bacterium]|nr:class I SAM-dependent RNA methyltransferase [Candidatus Acidoferrales bacterium]